MEKEQKPVMAFMMEQTYRPIIFRSIANLMLLKIGELITTVYRENEIPQEEKKEFIKYILERESVKKKFIEEMERIKKREIDVIAEILKQHHLDKNVGEATYFHDQMCVIFREECIKIVNLIITGNYQALYYVKH